MAKGASKFGALADFRKEQASDEAEVGTQILDEVDVEDAAKASALEAASPAPAPEMLPLETAASAPVGSEPRRRGRPAGKRSDPDWKLFSHFLRKRTQRRATLILTARDDSVDLSDVLEELLEAWVEQNEGR